MAARPDATTVVVVAHTHWDREWYLSFERFRLQLVDLVDDLLRVLDEEPAFAHFLLDGQTVVLEDYLAVRPEMAGRLQQHARQGRIALGPWYVLPDEFLVSAESLVRNLLLGRRLAAPYGGAMPIGYLPDTFGHPAQIPQILRGFGIDSAVIYRGVETDRSEFVWEAPDGSQVLTVFLPGGYCNGMAMVTSPKRWLEVRQDEVLADLRARATTSTLLLMAGCDHLPASRDLPRLVEAANRRLADRGVRLHLGTLAEYVERVRAARPTLHVLRGEFRRPRPGRITPGVLSTRMYLKQESFRSSVVLERLAEPLAALAWLLGEPYPVATLWQAWKYLLQNHPHDSICGCSVDEVHQDMLPRFRWVREIGLDLARRALAAVATRVDDAFGQEVGAFLIFNPLPRPRRGLVPVTLHFLAPGARFHLLDSEGRVVPHQEVRRRPASVTFNPARQAFEGEGRQEPLVLGTPRRQLHAYREDGVWRRWEGEAVEVLVDSGWLPPLGYAGVAVVVEDEPARRGPVAPATGLRAGSDWLENEHVRVDVRPDGTLDLLDKRHGVRYRGLNVFEHRADAGDEYTYCPPPEDEVVRSEATTARVALVEEGPLRATLEIAVPMLVPARLAPDRRRRSAERVELPITVRVRLAAGQRRIEVETEVDNRAEDALLRVLFPTPFAVEWVDAADQFGVTRRRVGLDPDEARRLPGPDEEVAVAAFPQKGFVDASHGRHGLAVLNLGLPESEAEPVPEGVRLSLTLLRSVGWLSRPDLWTRHGNAGPSLPTPEAQCPGRHRFQYALLPHEGNWESGGVQSEAEDYATPFPVVWAPGLGEQLPPRRGFVHVEPATLAFSAFKRAEEAPSAAEERRDAPVPWGGLDGDEAVVLRCYNPTGGSILASVAFGFPVAAVARANLAEEPLERLEVVERRVQVTVRPAEIVTLKVWPTRRTG